MKKQLQTLIILIAIGGGAYGAYQLFFADKHEFVLPDEPEMNWGAPLRKVKQATKPTVVPIAKSLPTQEPAAETVQESVAQEPDSVPATTNINQTYDQVDARPELVEPKTGEEATSEAIMLALMEGNASDAQRHIASLDPARIESAQAFSAVATYHLSQGNQEGLHMFVDAVASGNPHSEPQISASLLKAQFTAQAGDIESARELIKVTQQKAQATGKPELIEQAQNAHSGLYLLEGQKALLEENDVERAQAFFDKAVENAVGEDAELLKGMVSIMKMQLQQPQ